MSMLKKLLILTLLSQCVALSPVWGAVGEGDPVAEVQAQVIAFNRAYEMNELDDYFSYYCDNATMWINTDFVNIAEYRKDWYALIEAGGSVQKNTVSEIRVQAGPGGDSAVASYRLEIETRQPAGEITSDQAQETDTWFRSDGKWCVAHLHYSFQSVD